MRHPIVKWAQRSDKVYVTLDLADAKDVKLKLEPHGRFIFSASKDGLPYQLDFELLHQINVEKGEKKRWSRLLKQEGKPPVFLKVDWDKWVDEDDDNERNGMDFDDMDFSNLGMGEDDDFDMDEPKVGGEEEEEFKEKAEEGSAKVAEEAKA